jgi:alanine dehydrogenase
MGKLLGGVKGVEPAIVVVIGGGVVGVNAAKMAAGLGAQVYILDRSLERLAYLDDVMPANCFPLMSNDEVFSKLVSQADLVIGAVLIPGAKAPKLLTHEMIKQMKPGSVVVDVAIDQGGCFETSRATTHDDPVYEVDGVLHYCVANMPGAVPMTSTKALTNATLSYALEIANNGWENAMRNSEEIKKGANVINGALTYKAVAEAFGLDYTPIDNLL